MVSIGGFGGYIPPRSSTRNVQNDLKDEKNTQGTERMEAKGLFKKKRKPDPEADYRRKHPYDK